MSSFDTDVMEDLFYDEAEGPARSHHFDEFEEFEGEESDEFLRNIIGGIGRVVGGLVGGGDQFEEAEDWAEEYEAYDEYEGRYEALDAMEEAVVDALEAEEPTNFSAACAGAWAVCQNSRVAVRTVGRGIPRRRQSSGRSPDCGTAWRASFLIPPRRRLAGRIAVAGRVGQANRRTNSILWTTCTIFAEDEYAIDAAMPVIAGLTIRRTMPGVSRLPRPARRQLVRGVAQATRAVARRQGPQAARAAVPPWSAASNRRPPTPHPAPCRASGYTATAARVARSPVVARRMAARAGVPAARRPMGVAGRRQRYTLRGPVTISIQGR